MASVDALPFPMILVPYTEMLPETAELSKLTLMRLVFDPHVIVAPAGRVHIYPLACEIESVEKTIPPDGLQILTGPPIRPAGPGIVSPKVSWTIAKQKRNSNNFFMPHQ